jgi:hypothetical protein
VRNRNNKKDRAKKQQEVRLTQRLQLCGWLQCMYAVMMVVVVLCGGSDREVVVGKGSSA